MNHNKIFLYICLIIAFFITQNNITMAMIKQNWTAEGRGILCVEYGNKILFDFLAPITILEQDKAYKPHGFFNIKIIEKNSSNVIIDVSGAFYKAEKIMVKMFLQFYME